MFDVSSALSAVGGVGALTLLQQTYRYARDERRKKIENGRSDAQAPVVERALLLGLADQATTIQGRAIAALNGQVDGLEEDLAEERATSTRLRGEIAAKDVLIRELYQTIGQMETGRRRKPPVGP